MPTSYNRPLASPTALAPFNIQCTQFYCNRCHEATSQLRLLKKSYKRIPKSLSEPIMSAVEKQEHKRQDSVNSIATVCLLNRYPQSIPCLDISLAENIRHLLPSRVAILSRWSLVYSLDQHGASLNTLYQKCKESSGPCLLVIRDSYDETFGAYLTEPIHRNSSFYGTGECFLWNKQAQRVCSYSWTSKNNHMIYSDQDILAIGNGEGSFGLCIHSDLIHGYTEPCATYDNPALTVTNAFECTGLEIWSFLH